MPQLFYSPVGIHERESILQENLAMQFVTYLSDALISTNVFLFLLNSHISVIEQLWMGLSQDNSSP